MKCSNVWLHAYTGFSSNVNVKGKNIFSAVEPSSGVYIQGGGYSTQEKFEASDQRKVQMAHSS